MPAVRPLLDELDRSVDAIPRTSTVDELLGVEGLASRHFFAALPHLLQDDWGFTTRRRRPPTDPVNSLLSFAYTLLTRESASALAVCGLDPYVGFLHSMRRNRESLALDLIEEFRTPVVDSLVLRVLNRRILSPEHFATVDAQGTVHVTDDGRRIFLKEYEFRMNTLFRHGPTGERTSYRAALTRQAEQLVACIHAPGVTYIPVMLT